MKDGYQRNQWDWRAEFKFQSRPLRSHKYPWKGINPSFPPITLARVKGFLALVGDQSLNSKPTEHGYSK